MNRNKGNGSVVITENKKICRDHYVISINKRFSGKAPGPGQFVNVLVEERGTDPLLRIPLGIHRIRKNGISLLYKVVGQATEILSEKKRGEKIDILGPLGKGFVYEKRKKVSGEEIHALIAGGHGAAPLYALAEALRREGREVIVFLGAYCKEHIVMEKEFVKAGCAVHIATNDGSAGTIGMVTCLAKNKLMELAREKKINLYACGPWQMLSATAKIADEMEIRAQVSVDSYMACGTGVCRGCAVMTKQGYKLVCSDGPVFYSDEIIWEER